MLRNRYLLQRPYPITFHIVEWNSPTPVYKRSRMVVEHPYLVVSLVAKCVGVEDKLCNQQAGQL